MKARDIDIIFGTPARLAITATLVSRIATGGPLSFTQLRQETGLADGNLHVQTKRLVEAGYLSVGKMQSGNRTLTSFQLTELGQDRFQAHIRLLAGVAGGDLGFWRSSERTLEGSQGKPISVKDDSQVW